MVNSVKVYVAGMKGLGRHLRTALFIYVVYLFLALLIGLPLIGRLAGDFRGSMLPEELLKGFDSTAFSELLRNSAETVATVTAQARWVLLLSIVLSVFFSGGIFSLIDKKEIFSIRSFFAGAQAYMFRFFRLFLCMTMLQLLAAVLVYLPLGLLLKSTFEKVATETSLFFIGLGGMSLHLLLLTVLVMTSFYAKVGIVTGGERKVLREVFRSLSFVLKHFVATFTLFLLLFLSFVLLAWGFLLLGERLASVSGQSIFLAFLVQQLFMFVRSLVRLWTAECHYRLFSCHHNSKAETDSAEPVPLCSIE